MFCATLDLTLNYGCTASWWQLFKALHDIDVKVVTTTYRGSAIASPWWMAYENPTLWQGNLVASAQEVRYKLFGNALRSKKSEPQANGSEGIVNKFSRALAQKTVLPKWEAHLVEILEKEQDIDAILFVGVPPNQLAGLPTYLREQYKIPVIWYDPDAPVSLPSHQGFPRGFSIYPGADITEYDAVMTNSLGSVAEFKEMGAKEAEALFWAADPEIFRPVSVANTDYDVSFYGYGDAFREEAMTFALAEPSRKLTDRRFVIAGARFQIDLGNSELIGPIQPNQLGEFCARSKLNLNITRSAHGNVYASSTTRIFEMAAMGCCIVTTPYSGVEEWFEPDEEIFIVNDADEAISTYERLLQDESTRAKVGEKARERIHSHHTYQHRARQIVDLVNRIR